MLSIMRHGKTDWNVTHKLQGWSDIPLNEEGRQMARDAKNAYCGEPFDICYCSPLERAKETAKIFLEGSDTPIVLDERLREMSFGIYEGTQNAAKKPDCPVYTLFQDPAHYIAPPKAENLQELYARSNSFITEVLTPEYVSSHRILIVAHGALLCSIINQYEHIEIDHFWDSLLRNCQLKQIVP